MFNAKHKEICFHPRGPPAYGRGGDGWNIILIQSVCSGEAYEMEDSERDTGEGEGRERGNGGGGEGKENCCQSHDCITLCGKACDYVIKPRVWRWQDFPRLSPYPIVRVFKKEEK